MTRNPRAQSYGQDSPDSNKYFFIDIKLNPNQRMVLQEMREFFQKVKDVAALDFERQENQIGKFRKYLTVFL